MWICTCDDPKCYVLKEYETIGSGSTLNYAQDHLHGRVQDFLMFIFYLGTIVLITIHMFWHKYDNTCGYA